MASLTTVSFNLKFSPLYHSSTLVSHGSVQLARFNRAINSLRLSSSHCISGFRSLVPPKLCTISPSTPRRPQSLTVFAFKGYKMKTHKASTKRFRVTGRGKIVRRRAGKQHLLAKKNTKRKLRLSKMDGEENSKW